MEHLKTHISGYLEGIKQEREEFIKYLDEIEEALEEEQEIYEIGTLIATIRDKINKRLD